MLLRKHYKEGASVVTHFWVPTNKKIYIIIIKKKEFEQCRFDTVPLPAARPAEIKGAEPRQSRPMADQPQHDLLPRRTSKRDQLLSPYKKERPRKKEEGEEKGGRCDAKDER